MEVEGEQQLYLIMTDIENEYVIYAIKDPQNEDVDETAIINLEQPLIKLDRSTFPSSMSFAAIGSRIFMVGGSEISGGCSRKVFIFDTVSCSVDDGPLLNSAKLMPRVFSFGSKLFALSYAIYSYDSLKGTLDSKPRFEMLETDHIGSKWSALPVPRLRVTKMRNDYSVRALAAVYVGGGTQRPVVFISVSLSGTYAFDVDKNKWKYVSDEHLPFSGHAVSMPHDPSLCYGYSVKSDRFCAFRLYVDEGIRGYQVNEFEVENSYIFSSLLPPLCCCRPSRTVYGPNGRVYEVMTGVDEPDSYNSAGGNRYVHVYALRFTNQVGISKADSEREEWQMRKCSNKKREAEAGGSQDKGVDGGSHQESRLRRCETKKKMKKRRCEQGKDEQETQELKMEMVGVWKRSFCGGPIADRFIHVAGAFALCD